MINLATLIPSEVALAVSGGSDSMAALDFLLKGRREVTVLHFDHGTIHACDASEFVVDYCTKKGLSCHASLSASDLPRTDCTEQDHRQARLDWFSRAQFKHELGPIHTGHNLDDAVEWWIQTSLRGKGHLMPVVGATTKPFLFTPKGVLLDYCINKKVPFIEDPSNALNKYSRNIIRNEIMPHALKINPGLRGTIARKYQDL